MDKVLVFSKKLLLPKLKDARVVVDATVGNGNDTLFLAENTAAKVYGFDIQEQALANAKKLLIEHNKLENCQLILDSHLNFEKYIPESIQAAVFNLGYLPQADHNITTTAEVTIPTLELMLSKLSLGGIIVIVVYWGHANGKVEKERLLEWCVNIDQKKVEVLKYEFINQKNNAPFILALEKRKDF